MWQQEGSKSPQTGTYQLFALLEILSEVYDSVSYHPETSKLSSHHPSGS